VLLFRLLSIWIGCRKPYLFTAFSAQNAPVFLLLLIDDKSRLLLTSEMILEDDRGSVLDSSDKIFVEGRSSFPTEEEFRAFGRRSK
jgi:hypothetical protein